MSDRPARVRVTVPATSANLGPGFDTLGLALGRYDVVTAEAGFGGDEEPVVVRVEGTGAGQVPTDDTHLVVQAMRACFAELGTKASSLRLDCHNDLPHGRGLGSSAAAIVSGVLAARELSGSGHTMDDAAALALAGRIEGHPDNVAPCLLGGLTIAWTDDHGVARAVREDVHPDVTAIVCVPDTEVSTQKARALLPASVSHADAARNAGRAALLVEALTRRPDLLLEATDDRLHQSYRAPAMPGTLALVAALRAAGRAAVVSGAGPSVLVLSAGDDLEPVSALAVGWSVQQLPIEPRGAVVERESGVGR